MNAINQDSNIAARQALLLEGQSYAMQLPDMGIDPNKMASWSLDHLSGVVAFLKRRYEDREG